MERFQLIQKLKQNYIFYWYIYNNFGKLFLDNQIARKSLQIGLVLVILNQFCGYFAMINYTATIFLESGSSLTPNMSAIIIGGIQIIGVYSSTLLVDRAGRKILLAISSFGACAGYLCLGAYIYLSSMYSMDGFEWIPIVSFGCIMYILSIGLIPLPSTLQTEILPQKIRAIGLMICVTATWLLAFVMVKIFPFLMQLLGMHGCMFLFAGCSLVGGAYVVIIVPETKGKSFDEIMNLLR